MFDVPSLIGGLAQLVERVNGIHEVEGSTPLPSTTAVMCIAKIIRNASGYRSPSRYQQEVEYS